LAKVLLDQAIKKDARLSALVHLLYSSGARIAEILALDLSDIDFTARKFQVIGKGNKQRWCFYNEDTDFCLNNYIKYYRHSQINALFTAQKPNNLYFCSFCTSLMSNNTHKMRRGTKKYRANSV
jgi:integrase/recombinase XerD